jgi:hypothetical protein
MNKVFLLLAVFALIAVAVGAASVEDQLWANEKAIWEGFKTGDQKAFSMIADDGMSADPMGVSTKAQMMQMMSDMKMTDYSISDQKAQMVDHDTYILHYTCSGTGTYKGQPMPSGKSHCSSVWHKTGTKWLAVYHQETPMMEMGAQTMQH